MIKRIEVVVRGRVQMVMFRDFVKRGARKLGLTGWVRNETNGTVRVVAEGEEEPLRLLIERIRKGSLLSRVDGVECNWKQATQNFNDFIIDY